MDRKASGPLTSLRIVEFAGIGPAPFGAMLLADLGAQMIRIDRPRGYPPPDPSLDFEAMGSAAIFNRSRHTVRVDLKNEAGRALVMRLVGEADALIEGYRPGVMEKLGLGPDVCLAGNPRLVYARVTGWGQDGPLAQTSGHDLNYIAISGALSLFARDGVPPIGIPPLIGDMGGGGLFMALGLLAAIVEGRQSGRGQVVDAAIVDGSAALYALLKALRHVGAHAKPGGRNVLDGGRYFYRTYRCADGGYVAVGAIEPAFRRALLERLAIRDEPQWWSDIEEDDARCTEILASIFAGHPRSHWEELFEGSDACVFPVLEMEEAEAHPHARARGAFEEIACMRQHAPSPRFSRTPGRVSVDPAEAGRHNPEALLEWGLSKEEIEALRKAGGIA